MESTDGNEVVIDYRQRNHPIKVVKVGKTLTVKANGQDILKTRNAYLLDEHGHKPVYYFPISDIDREFLRETSTESVCPFKGKAHYYSLVVGGTELKDSVWRYSEPSKEFAAIRDYIAFYDNSIDSIEES